MKKRVSVWSDIDCPGSICGYVKVIFTNRQVCRFYRKVRTRTLAEELWRKADPDALSFKNVNTPSDLAEIDGLERS